MDKINWFIDKFQLSLSDDEQVDIFNRYCDLNGIEEHIHPMCDINEFFKNCTPLEILSSVADCEFNVSDEYFSIVRGSVESFNDPYLSISDYLNDIYTCKEAWEDLIDERGYLEEIFEEYNQNSKGIEVGSPLENPIRVEVYTGIRKLGVLYRMLTLNTGQTQMTTRHQIEIIYSDYKNNCDVEGVRLLSEVDSETPSTLGEYKFRDVVDGFTSYLQKDYLTLDRMDILDNIKNLERLSEEDMNVDLFNGFIGSYHHFVCKLNELYPYEKESEVLKYELDLIAAPYATSYIKLFNKSQSLTGFGNAIASLRDLGLLENINSLNSKIDSINGATAEMGFNNLILNLDKVRSYAKKIGNDQRLYFHHFFKKLFDTNEASYLDVNDSATRAFSEYQRVVS